MSRTARHIKHAFLGAVALLLVASAAPASAQAGQAWAERGYFNLNLGFESTSGTLSDAATFVIYDETGTKSVEQNVDSGALFDFSVGSRVWRNVSVGIGYHRGGSSSEASATALVPHPVVFNANRATAAAIGDLDRTEQAFHLQVGYMIPLNDQVSVHVTIGPSFFSLKQDVLADLAFTEQGVPFRDVTATPIVQERTDSATGMNVGVDVMYKLWEVDTYNFGAGAFLRYAGASARITVLENSVDSDVGGLQFGIGGRMRF
jgi:hypothetical protein